MSTATATPIRAARGSNFASKSERKRIRKSMIRSYVSNKVADARTGAKARADFYRQLRQMKQRRLDIAKEMYVLSNMVHAASMKAAGAQTLVESLKATTPAQKKTVKDLCDAVDETVAAGQQAAKATAGVALEFNAFAKRRIYYAETM